MTDEQMDARLRRAGEEWRAATAPAVTEVAMGEPHKLTPPMAARPRRHRTGLLASAAVVAAALVAGGTVLVADITGGEHSNGADTSPLERTVWRFVGYGDRLDENSLSTFYISPDGQLVADDECEMLGAKVDSAGSSLAISGITERDKECTDTYQPAFSQGIDLLNSTPTYTIDSDGLTIGTGADAMHFVPAANLLPPTTDVPTFTETTWRLATVHGEENSELPASEPLQLRIDGDQLTADAGCVSIGGTVTINGPDVSLNEGIVSGPACVGDGELVQRVISDGFTQQVRGTELTISKQGVGSLIYQWAPADRSAFDPHRLAITDWTLASIAGDPAPQPLHLTVGGVDGSLSFDEGCGGWNGGQVRIGVGTFQLSGMRTKPLAECTGDAAGRAQTLESFFGSDPALWRIQDDDLIIYGGGAQAFALVYKPIGTPQPPDVALVGTNWTLSKILDTDKQELPVADNATLLIDGANHVTGNDSCNSISGDVTIDKATVDFGNGLGGTDIGCSGVQNATEQHIYSILSGQVAWSIDGNQLALTKDGVGTLVYQAGGSNPPTPTPLVDTTWTLTTIENGPGANGTASSVVTDVTVVFDGGGHVTITHRCYTDHADVDIAKGTLDISNEHLQRAIPCSAEPTQQQEQDENQIVDDVLSGKSTWTIDQDQLSVTKDGVGTLVFTNARLGVTKDLALVSTKWQLTGIETETSGGGSGNGSSDTQIVLSISADGTYHLATRCHNYDGTAAVSGSTITFSDQHDNGGLDCLDTLAEGTAHLLDGTVGWAIDNDQLTLTKGGSKATFTG